jgi:hypothetical protein
MYILFKERYNAQAASMYVAGGGILRIGSWLRITIEMPRRKGGNYSGISEILPHDCHYQCPKNLQSSIPSFASTQQTQRCGKPHDIQWTRNLMPLVSIPIATFAFQQNSCP